MRKVKFTRKAWILSFLISIFIFGAIELFHNGIILGWIDIYNDSQQLAVFFIIMGIGYFSRICDEYIRKNFIKKEKK